MAIESATTVKSYFETGDRPTQGQFVNLIDSAMRDTLIAIATAGEGGATGIVEIESTAAVTTRSAGAVGIQILSAAATASAQGHLGAGTVGIQMLGVGTTASGQQALGGSTVGIQIFGAAGTASAQQALGGGTVGIQILSAITTASAQDHLGPWPAVDFLATADASSDATIDFTAFDSTEYDAYLFILSNVIPVTDAAVLLFRTSTDGGSTFASTSGDYIRQLLGRDSADAANAISTDGSSTVTSVSLSGFVGVGSAAGEDGYSGRLWVYGPHLAKDTRFTYEGTFQDSDGNERVVYGSGRRNVAEDVNAIRFAMDSGNIESGTITMYGFRNI